MKNFVIFLLIVLLTGFGPVTGAQTHAHEIGSHHDHVLVDRSMHSTAKTDSHEFHSETGDGANHGQPGHDQSEFALAGALNAPTDSGDQVFHVHMSADGAPSGIGEIRLLIPFSTVPRSLKNSDQAAGPELSMLRRPPKAIL